MKAPKEYEISCKGNLYTMFEIRASKTRVCRKVFHNGLTKTSYEQAKNFIRNNLSKDLLDTFIEDKKIKFILF